MTSANVEDLRGMRGRLLARSTELAERLRRVRADLGRAREPLPGDSADAAIVMENDDVLRAIESTALQEIRHIEHALERIDAGHFGTCESCGGPIKTSRLEVVPYATRCTACEGGP
jgi:RNA polymerase-binding transcription factor DksA